MTASAHVRAKRSRPARIASVCIAGRPVTQKRSNTDRLELISKVVRKIRRIGWSELDALVFPAGYLRLKHWFGPIDHGERLSALDDSELGEACKRSAERLQQASPGCLMVVGIDTNSSPEGWRGDQLVAAFGTDGLTGLARKIFPSDGDTNSATRAPYLLFEPDFGSTERVVRLANGENALLSACYDAFALAELRLGPTSKRRTLRYLSDAKSWKTLDRRDADCLLAQFDHQLRSLKPTINLVAIHGFERAGAQTYWQRHGIATACAALGGGLTIGAAHFAEALPAELDRAPLAALNVPRSHLRASHHRKARPLAPIDGFETALKCSPAHRALVRLFEAD